MANSASDINLFYNGGMSPDSIAPAAPHQIDSRVIVSCAGSGKTHKLINRLLQLLAAGAKPGEILIITFTNKAAAEIRSRLLTALTVKAAADCPDADWRQIRRRILLAANPADALSVHTFHNWFLSLLQNRPWSDNIGGAPTPVTDEEVLFEESWRRWQRRAEQNLSPELKQVLADLSPNSLRKLCEEFKNNRNVWLLCKDESQMNIAATESQCKSAAAQAAQNLRQAAGEFALHARGTGKTFFKAREASTRLADGDSEAADEKEKFFIKNNQLRQILRDNADKKNYTAVLAALSEKLTDALTAVEEISAARFCHAALSVCADFDREWVAVKSAGDKITFNDMELGVWEMLQDAAVHNALSHRLYMRYRHILIDEFQDTSPLQWQIVRSWLLDSHGNDEQPSVFIVGDAKQAIYGFRHGDSRLLKCAEEFLRSHYEAQEQAQENICRRCGDNILKVVNATFGDRLFLSDFVAHQTGAPNADLSARVEWHAYPAVVAAPRCRGIRNPLQQPRGVADNVQERRAAAVADKVAEILNHWHIRDNANHHGKSLTRPVSNADILILMPRLTHAAEQIDALSARGVDCAIAGGRRVSFLDFFECADILDLIAVLLSAGRDYSLARVLKSPIFSMTDQTLSAIVGCDDAVKKSLWEKLQENSEQESRRARVLLKLWRRRAMTTLLPAHDFLSRLFVQGNIVARYRAAVADTLKERVDENLSRLLDLSLLIEGGARPLLSQFLADARRRRGENDASPSAVGGVRLMTIHAAKGLQAPIIILADADFSAGGHGQSADILIDWRPTQKQPSRFVIALRRHRLAHSSLRAEAKKLTEREKANQLYVAMTRAEQALIIFSSAEPKGVAALPVSAMRQLVGQEATESAATSLIFGDELRGNGKSPPSLVPPVVGGGAPIGHRKTQTAAMLRGEMRHQIVALLLSGVSLSLARRLVAAEEEIWRQAATMATSPPLQELLNDSREVLVERDFVAEEKILRPDLVIVREQTAWVVDYKTGRVDVARHRPQLESYRRVVGAHYPKCKIHIAVLDIRGRLHDLDD